MRFRHDGFTPARRRRFLEVLTETGCVKDAACEVNISTTTAYRTKKRLPAFAHDWETAQAMAASPIELLAFERATVGAPKKIWRKGKLVRIEQKPSDMILRTLLLITAKAREKQPPTKLKRRQQRVEYILRTVKELIPPEDWAEGPMGARVPPGYKLVPVGDSDAGAETDADGEPVFRSGGTGGARTSLPPPADGEAPGESSS